jgi:hypothetical protein
MEGLWKMVTQCLLIMLGFITQKHIALTCTRHKYTWDGPKAWNKFQKLNFKKQKIKWFWKPGELNLFEKGVSYCSLAFTGLWGKNCYE